MDKQAHLNLQKFYPESLIVEYINQSDESITIQLKSGTTEYECPKCHTKSKRHHGTYTRKAQDLPIVGKRVYLEITAYEYSCDNNECEVISVSEGYTGFLGPYSRLTERCEYFICALALETSCEGSARICRTMGLQISGDTIIRMLVNQFEAQESPLCGDSIGIDDFAFKKRRTYGTIIVDEKSRRPVAVLDGRDGEAFKTWLKKNQQVKTVTRDRASSYAKALSEELPDCRSISFASKSVRSC